jgi:hypothetical protein
MKTHGRTGGIAPSVLISALDRSMSISRPCRFIPGTHCVSGWVDPRAGLAVMRKRKTSWFYGKSSPYSNANNFYGPAHSTKTSADQIWVFAAEYLLSFKIRAQFLLHKNSKTSSPHCIISILRHKQSVQLLDRLMQWSAYRRHTQYINHRAMHILLDLKF